MPNLTIPYIPSLRNAYNSLLGDDSRYRMTTIECGRRSGRTSRLRAAAVHRQICLPGFEPDPIPFTPAKPFTTGPANYVWFEEPDESYVAWMPIAHSLLPVSMPTQCARITSVD